MNNLSATPAKRHGLIIQVKGVGAIVLLAPDLHDVVQLLHILLNPDHHPILVHCTKGQHRTGCLIGCLRKIQNWSLSSIFQEYTHFTTPRYSRVLDHQFIELFPREPELIAKMAQLGHI